MSLKSCSANFTIKPTQFYQIAFIVPETGKRFYMGTKWDLKSDLREDVNQPSKFLSAGMHDYHSFRWTHDNGRIC